MPRVVALRMLTSLILVPSTSRKGKALLVVKR
jgi:hypothetical protein